MKYEAKSQRIKNEIKANLISNDIINYYNQHPDMSAIQINQIKSYFERPENFRYKKDLQKFYIDHPEFKENK